MNKYPGQICQDENLNNEFNNLHHEIVDKIIQFCKRNNLNIDEISLSIDGMLTSIPHEKWQAGTDSSFMMWGNDEKPYLWSI